MEFIEIESENAIEDAISSIGKEQRLIICGSSESKELLEENLEISEKKLEEILSASKKINVKEWFAEKRKELEEDWECDLSENEGEWIGERSPKEGFIIATDLSTGKPLEGLVGARVSTDSSWKIPAFFNYGGWNDCPFPEIHCAIWKYWEEKYGAKIIGMSHDTIEAYVSDPPNTKEEAMELAWEQYLYCYDIVDQGVETVSNLGSSIINHNGWFFWWD